MTAHTFGALALALLCPGIAHADDPPTQAGFEPSHKTYLTQYAAPNYGPPPSGYGSPPPPPPPGYYPPQRRYGYARPVAYQPVYQHDGFYLHMHLGGGYTSLTAKNQGTKTTLSGGSLALGIAAGGSIAPNLILFGTLYDNIISDPNITVNGVGGLVFDTSAHLIGLGIGLAYYLMPANVYFAGALSGTWLRVDDNYYDNIYLETNTGIGFQGLVGKEWWAWPGWGIGVAAQVTLASMKSSDFSDERWSGGSLAILFSATYN